MARPQISGFFSPLVGSLAVAVALGGCGGDGDDGSGDPDAAANVDAEIPSDYTRLIGREWTLPPGAADTYRCVRVTVPTETYITNIMAQAPLGTHHTVLSISDSRTSGPDGVYDCTVSELGMVMLYASGVGTSPLDFPDGVGVRVPAGTQIHLNLHLYNASDAPLSGESAILVRSQATPTPTLAEMVFAGTFLVSIPANSTDHTISGGCTANADYSLFAVWPHMHQLATHQKVEHTRSGSTTVLHDHPFSFAEQNYYRMEPQPFAVQSGDQIRVTCTYDNPTGSTVTFGDSSNQEMCFSGLYRYPAQGGNIFSCSTGGGFF